MFKTLFCRVYIHFGGQKAHFYISLTVYFAVVLTSILKIMITTQHNLSLLCFKHIENKMCLDFYLLPQQKIRR